MCVDKKKEHVYIKCNSIVKKFTMERVRQLGIDVGLAQLYVSLSKDGSISCKRDAHVVKLAAKLIKIIPGIRPRIMMTTADVNELTQFIMKWKERLSELIVKRQYTPIYYEDIVNSLLAGKSDINCTSVHLGWCLSILGPKNMKPGKIADEILKHQSQEWEELLPLAYDDYYSVRLSPTSEDIQDDFRNKIEFIYRLSIPTTNDSLISELKNDIEVVTDIKHLYESSPADYRELIKKYLEFIGRLQTVSSSILPKKLIRKLEGIVNQTEEVTGTSEVEIKTDSNSTPPKTYLEPPKPAVLDLKPIHETHSPSSAQSASIQNTPPPSSDDSLVTTTIPEKEYSFDIPDEVPGEPGDDEFNYEELMDYLNEKLINDSAGREKIKNAMDIIYAFCKLENFDARFTQLRAMIDSGTVKWPGGFAVGEMRKMLNPDYVPNIR